MQTEQEFYRCLVSDAAGRALLRIRDILADDSLSDERCFQKIEAVVTLLEELGVDGKTAAADASLMEHAVSPESYEDSPLRGWQKERR